MKYEMSMQAIIVHARRGLSLYQTADTSCTFFTSDLKIHPSTLRRIEIESASRYFDKLRETGRSCNSLQIAFDASAVGYEHEFMVMQAVLGFREGPDPDGQPGDVLRATTGIVVGIPQVPSLLGAQILFNSWTSRARCANETLKFFWRALRQTLSEIQKILDSVNLTENFLRRERFQTDPFR